jgi:hypothetical protein
MNAVVLWKYSQLLSPSLDLTDVAERLMRMVDDVTKGNRTSHEAILSAQQVALNAIFIDLAVLAKDNIKGECAIFDRLMRIALRAQSQCRATAETLFLMQNPPVFARQFQANIANGPQQVNNGTRPGQLSHAGESESAPNKLLEAHGERLDAGTTGAAGASDSPLAPMDAIDRPAQRRRKGASRP